MSFFIHNPQIAQVSLIYNIWIVNTTENFRIVWQELWWYNFFDLWTYHNFVTGFHYIYISYIIHVCDFHEIVRAELVRYAAWFVISVRLLIHPLWQESGVGLSWFNTLRPRRNGRHFADDTFKRIFLNTNVTISIKISLKFVPSIGSDNGLAPSRRQTIIWTNDG